MSDKNIIRITRHHSTNVVLRSGNKPEVTIPVGPIFDLDSVDQYDADELRGILNDSLVEYESVDSSAEAGSVGGSDALSAAHRKPDPRVSATMTSGIQPESDDRKDALQPDAYGGDLEGDGSGGDNSADESDKGAGGSNKKAASSDDRVENDSDAEGADRAELLALLDQNVADLTESLKGRSEADLRALRKAEVDGKSRSSALKAIDEALNPSGDE